MERRGGRRYSCWWVGRGGRRAESCGSSAAGRRESMWPSEAVKCSSAIAMHDSVVQLCRWTRS